jgi:mRNA-degrading endonuclease RelE of RelBE toxin-antitoxin system
VPREVDAPHYEVRFQAAARKAIAQRLPEAVAAAVIEFCTGPLAEDPHRVGKRLFGPLVHCHGARRGSYRVVYQIDDEALVVEVLQVAHRADVYRSR